MGSFSQTLFFGEVKRQPEIRLRSQANCTGMIFMIKVDNYLFLVSVDRQTFLDFKTSSNSRDTSPLSNIKYMSCLKRTLQCRK